MAVLIRRIVPGELAGEGDPRRGTHFEGPCNVLLRVQDGPITSRAGDPSLPKEEIVSTGPHVVAQVTPGK